MEESCRSGEDTTVFTGKERKERNGSGNEYLHVPSPITFSSTQKTRHTTKQTIPPIYY